MRPPFFLSVKPVGLLTEENTTNCEEKQQNMAKMDFQVILQWRQEHQYYYGSDYTYNEASGREHAPAAFISLCIHLPSWHTFYCSFFRVWMWANVFFNMLCIFPYSVSLRGNISVLSSTTSSVITMIIMASSRSLSWFCLLYFFGFMDYIALDLWKKAGVTNAGLLKDIHQLSATAHYLKKLILFINSKSWKQDRVIRLPSF